MVRVLHSVSIMNRAGEETFLMNLFRTIDRDAVSFDFLCSLPEQGDYDEEIRSLGGEVRHIELSRISTKLKQIDNFFRLYRYLWSVRDRYRVFHVHTQHAMDGFREALAAKLAGIPMVIVHSHNTSTQYHVKAHIFFRGFLNHIGICRLACSRAAGRWLFGENGKFEVICNGIDVGRYRFHPEIRDEVKEKNCWEDVVVIGHVGRFAHQKNHEFVIEIYREIVKLCPESRLVLVGKGELMDEIRAKADEYRLRDNVIFLGGRSDVDRLNQAFDVFLFPSRYEGLGIVLIEAQCAGLPCVISDVIPEDVDITDGIHRLSLSDGPEMWAAKVLEAAGKGKARNREQAYANVTAAGYSMMETTRRMTEIYCQK